MEQKVVAIFPLETVNYYCAGVHVRISFVQGNAEQ